MIDFNVIEACRSNGVKRVFYASSACVYPEHAQLDPANRGLQEHTAWPAAPQDAYGLEKLATEELYMCVSLSRGNGAPQPFCFRSHSVRVVSPHHHCTGCNSPPLRYLRDFAYPS